MNCVFEFIGILNMDFLCVLPIDLRSFFCYNKLTFRKKKVDLLKRGSGVLMHVSSLWGKYGIGGFGKSAEEWIDIIADMGFTYWQVLPFCITDDYNSPYKSFSAFSINPYFIDLDLLFEDKLLTETELALAKETSPYLCEFERLKKERLPLLKKASERFNHWDKVSAFLKENPHTEKFCLFMALKEANENKHWTEWKNEAFDVSTLKAWQFTQYVAYTQWLEIKKYANDKNIKIIGDIPI